MTHYEIKDGMLGINIHKTELKEGHDEGVYHEADYIYEEGYYNHPLLSLKIDEIDNMEKALNKYIRVKQNNIDADIMRCNKAKELLIKTDDQDKLKWVAK